MQSLPTPFFVYRDDHPSLLIFLHFTTFPCYLHQLVKQIFLSSELKAFQHRFYHYAQLSFPLDVKLVKHLMLFFLEKTHICSLYIGAQMIKIKYNS